jgi:hypothetical protein
MNVFVDNQLRETMAAVDSKAYEAKWWGKIGYLHVHLAKAKARDVKTLLHAAWARRAPKKLAAKAG